MRSAMWKRLNISNTQTREDQWVTGWGWGQGGINRVVLHHTTYT